MNTVGLLLYPKALWAIVGKFLIGHDPNLSEKNLVLRWGIFIFKHFC